MKRALVFLILAACAEPAPVFKPVEVDVPIVTPCRIAAPAQPDFALSHVATSYTFAQKTQAALIELDQRKAYEAEIESELTLCR
jgi:hypothetical protein